jgi:hypothetical protein
MKKLENVEKLIGEIDPNKIYCVYTNSYKNRENCKMFIKDGTEICKKCTKGEPVI